MRRIYARMRAEQTSLCTGMVQSGAGVLSVAHLVPSHINLGEAALADLLVDGELPYGAPGQPPRGVGGAILTTGHDSSLK